MAVGFVFYIKEKITRISTEVLVIFTLRWHISFVKVLRNIDNVEFIFRKDLRVADWGGLSWLVREDKSLFSSSIQII